MPSFLHAEGLTVDCPALGEITVDVAYGGNFYAIVEPQENYRDMADYSAGDLIAWSPVVRQRLNEKYSFVHPENPGINRLSHMLWTGAPTVAEADARNAVFYGDKAIDRSPCGTGTSARMAQLHAKGKLKAGDAFVHESIIGSLFKGRVEKEVDCRRQAGHHPLDRRLGAHDRAEHHLHRRPRSVRAWLRLSSDHRLARTRAVSSTETSRETSRRICVPQARHSPTSSGNSPCRGWSRRRTEPTRSPRFSSSRKTSTGHSATP